MDAWNCCRTCLDSKCLNPIFSVHENNGKLIETIHYTVGIKVETNDNLPQHICLKCLNFISEMDKFRKKVESVQRELLQKLQSNQLNIVKAENEMEFKIENKTIVSIKTEDSEDFKDYDNDMTLDNLQYARDHEKIIEISIDHPNSIILNNESNIKHTMTKTKSAKSKTRCKKENTDGQVTKEIKEEIKEEIECEYCHKILTSKLSLRNHYKMHTGFDVNCELWSPPTTPEVESPRPSTSRSGEPPPKRSRKTLRFVSQRNEDIETFLMDSASEDEFDGPGNVVEEAEEAEEDVFDFRVARNAARRLRNYENECEDDDVHDVADDVVVDYVRDSLRVEDNFSWSEDYSTFSGQEEVYLRLPGPLLETHDPVDIFMAVWDESIMNEIVRETNKYAWQIIAAYSETVVGIPEYLNSWVETTVGEMYRYFAMLILMSMCVRSRVVEYFTTGTLEMQKFRNIMSRNRFLLISRFLHFVDNESDDSSLNKYDRKISKIRPIVDHTNKRFCELYVPNKHLSLDESLLLWKGRLNWVQCIRTKAARFGIKSYELCEAVTGYQLRCLLYAGQDSTMIEGPVHGFQNCTDNVVLELMNGFLDVGHTLLIDNWYNQLSLTRYLKGSRKTDVIGTINPRRINVPDDIKHAEEQRMARGEQISRHCGDISLVAWKDLRLVTAMSTYHADSQVTGRRAGVAIRKPTSIAEYDRYMGGVDSKYQKLSAYMMERKRCKKWYMKVFKRLINTSLLNTYIIHKKNPTTRRLSHRDFRYDVAHGLLERFPMAGCPPSSILCQPGNPITLRLTPGQHFPEYTANFPGKTSHKPFRCVRCTAAGRRSMVTLICSICKVPLCVGTCWVEYHNLEKLKS